MLRRSLHADSSSPSEPRRVDSRARPCCFPSTRPAGRGRVAALPERSGASHGREERRHLPAPNDDCFAESPVLKRPASCFARARRATRIAAGRQRVTFVGPHIGLNVAPVRCPGSRAHGARWIAIAHHLFESGFVERGSRDRGRDRRVCGDAVAHQSDRIGASAHPDARGLRRPNAPLRGSLARARQRWKRAESSLCVAFAPAAQEFYKIWRYAASSA